MKIDDAIFRLRGKALFCKCEDCNAINVILAELAKKDEEIELMKKGIQQREDYLCGRL